MNYLWTTLTFAKFYTKCERERRHYVENGFAWEGMQL